MKTENDITKLIKNKKTNGSFFLCFLFTLNLFICRRNDVSTFDLNKKQFSALFIFSFRLILVYFCVTGLICGIVSGARLNYFTDDDEKHLIDLDVVEFNRKLYNR